MNYYFLDVSRRIMLIGSFSIQDGDGSKNVNQKVNAGCFKLLRSFTISFNLANFSGVEF